MDGIEGVSPDGVAGLFTPEKHSAALIFLRRLIGCTFDKIWTPGSDNQLDAGGACSGTNDVLAQLVAVINYGMLAVIALVATYLIFAALKDTANDGELGGRHMNPSWTLVGAALGAILCFPAFNGFSALQMATMQVAVWSTGFGDSAWRVAADKMANANTVNYTFKSMPDEGWFWSDPGSEAIMRQQIANALRVRVEGELCARLIAKGVQNMATTGDTSISSVMTNEEYTGSGGKIAQRSLYYKAGDALNNATGMCGSVGVTYIGKPITNAEAAFGTSLLSSSLSMDQQAEIALASSRYKTDAARAAAEALLKNLDTVGKTLAEQLFPPAPKAARSWGPAQVKAVTAAVNDVIEKTKNDGEKALKAAPEALQNATAGAMSGQHQAGWFFAILYQRVLINGATVLKDIGNGGINVTSVPVERDFPAVWGCRSIGSYVGMGYSCSDELQTYFREFSLDMAAFDQLAPVFANAGAGTNGIGTNKAGLGAVEGGDPGELATLVQSFLSMMKIDSSENDQGWHDPIPQMQAMGNTMFTYGSATLGLTKAGEFASKTKNPYIFAVANVVSAIGEFFSPIAWGLLIIGAVLAFVVPFFPMVYFFLAALSWLALVVQAIFTAPFWLVQMFYANRNGGIGNTGLSKALVALFAILIRPAFIIVGLVFCMYLMRVGLDYLNLITHNFVSVLGLSTSGVATSVGNIMLAFTSFLFYLCMCLALVSTCCKFIDGVGDFVMEAVEQGASRLFSSDGHRADGILGNPALAISPTGAGTKAVGTLAATAGRVTDKGKAALSAVKNLSRR